MEWPNSAKERVRFSKELAAWAPGLVDAVEREVAAISGECQVKALSAKQRKELQEYQRHCKEDHLPYRRDCAVCVEAAGRDRAHRRIKNPEAFSWSMDLAGPFHEGKDLEANRTRYFMVHVVTIPVRDGEPLVQGLAEQAGETGEEQPRADVDGQGDPDGDPLAPQGRDPKNREISAEDEAAIETEATRWAEYVQGREEVAVKTITWAVPLVSRKTEDVIHAAAQGYSRIRALGIPVKRVHLDRAKEFTCSATEMGGAKVLVYDIFCWR